MPGRRTGALGGCGTEDAPQGAHAAPHRRDRLGGKGLGSLNSRHRPNLLDR
jgi:hypothetical protein